LTSLSFDWIELLRGLNAASARYLIIGAHALGNYGAPRATGDLDIWIDRTAENAQIVYGVLAGFGAPLEALSVDDLQSEDLVFAIGAPPLRIGILTDASGIIFADAWKSRVEGFLGGIPVHYIGRDALIKNKRATGRTKDLADVEALEGG
jgi:hypothetical protein